MMRSREKWTGDRVVGVVLVGVVVTIVIVGGNVDEDGSIRDDGSGWDGHLDGNGRVWKEWERRIGGGYWEWGGRRGTERLLLILGYCI